MKTKIPDSEMRDRVERMRKYNKDMAKAGHPEHHIYQPQAEQTIRDYGHDPKRYGRIGSEMPKSAFLSRFTEEREPVVPATHALSNIDEETL